MIHPDIQILLTDATSKNGQEFMQNLCIITITKINNIDQNTDSHTKSWEINLIRLLDKMLS
jgi:transcription termination factor NusB